MARRTITVEENIDTANRQWQYVMSNAAAGILDRNYTVMAMNMLNKAHCRAINERKAYLIK